MLLHPRAGHRATTAFEDAGFTIMDQLAWIAGQGFAPGIQDLGAELSRIGAEHELAASCVGTTTSLRPALTPILLARAMPAGGGFRTEGLRMPADGEDRARTPGLVNDRAASRVTGRDARR